MNGIIVIKLATCVNFYALSTVLKSMFDLPKFRCVILPTRVSKLNVFLYFYYTIQANILTHLTNIRSATKL